MTEQERNLLRGCLKGEKSAWDAFVNQYSGLAYYAIKKTLSLYHVELRADIVEDLFQDFFLSLMRDDFRKLRQFRAERGTSLASWLRVIISRQTIDFLRRQNDPVSRDIDTLHLSQPDPGDSQIDEEQIRLLSQALETLPSRDRLFVQLYFYRGLPPQEIAAILRVSVGAVYTLKSRVLDKLRETLKKHKAL